MDIPAPRQTDRRRLLWPIGVGAAVLSIFLFSRIDTVAPRVDFDRVVVDTVRRGTLVRTVRGPGTLEPENEVQIPAMTSGRVERRLVVLGERVEADDVLLELSNPEVSLELLEAERELARAELALVALETDHRLSRLAVAADAAELQGRIGDERRRAEALDRLADSGGATLTESAAAAEAYRRTATQLEITDRRRAVMDSAHAVATAAQRREVGRLRRIVEFRRDRMESMSVAAAAAGIVTELGVEQGQWVTAGTLLGRLVLEGGLKAIIRVPERLAAEVAPGQEVTIDLRGTIVEGAVRRVDPAASGGSVAVEVALPDSLPPGARPDLRVEGTVLLGRLPDVLHVGRPARAAADAQLSLFRLTEADRAERLEVQTGATSVERIEIRSGLDEGDVVVLSDLGELATAPIIRLER